MRWCAAPFPALAAAAGLVSTLQLRNAGTIGGNLFVDTRCNYYDQSFFWRQAVGFCLKKDGDICLVAPGSRVCLAICSSDTAPVLSSLNAEAVLVSAQGSRQVPLDALYRDDGMYYLTKRPDELLQGVWIPEASFGWRNVYLKLRRRGSFDFPVLGVAAALRIAASGACEGAKIVLTAVASAAQGGGGCARGPVRQAGGNRGHRGGRGAGHARVPSPGQRGHGLLVSKAHDPGLRHARVAATGSRR